MSQERFIEIRLPKCVLYLTAQEIQSLLKHDMELWKTAIGRGKAFTRAANRKDQEAKKFARDEARDFYDH